jgi:hypothetical protein
VNATVLAAFTVPSLNGSATEETCGDAFSSVITCLITARLALLVSFSPSGAAKTTRAVAPSAEAWGNLSCSRSIACCEGVPGMLNASLVGPDSVAAPATVAAMITSHTAATSLRRRNENRPSRYRYHAISQVSLRFASLIHLPIGKPSAC